MVLALIQCLATYGSFIRISPATMQAIRYSIVDLSKEILVSDYSVLKHFDRT